MTVKELINSLAIMPQEALVVTEGYEDGYDTVNVETHGRVSLLGRTSLSVKENPLKEWWVGKYINSTGSRSMDVVLLYSGTKEENQ